MSKCKVDFGTMPFIPTYSPFLIPQNIIQTWQSAVIFARDSNVEYGGALVASQFKQPGMAPVDWFISLATVEKGISGSFVRKSREVTPSKLPRNPVYVGEWHTHIKDPSHSPEDFGFFQPPEHEDDQAHVCMWAYSIVVSPWGFVVACFTDKTVDLPRNMFLSQTGVIPFVNPDGHHHVICRQHIFARWGMPPQQVDSRTGKMLPLELEEDDV